jgi:hypothetical protein
MTRDEVLAVLKEAAYHVDGGPAPVDGDEIRQAIAAVSALYEEHQRVIWGICANARRYNNRRYFKAPLWTIVRDLTGQGSTAASGLCKRAGFDPDSIDRATDALPPIPEGK